MTGQQKTTEIIFELEDLLVADKLPKEVEIGIFRILQEGLNNAIKHSEGTNIFIHLSYADNNVCMLVRDNGKGFLFNEKKLLNKEFIAKSNGLKNMKERAELLGGSFNVSSSPGKGTILQLNIPV